MNNGAPNQKYTMDIEDSNISNCKLKKCEFESGSILPQVVEASGIATKAELATKQNTLPSGTSAQYLRGDLTMQALNKAAVGLGNADNTTDLAKPISTAAQTALNLKANLASPAFTGTPMAPTPSTHDKSQRIATMEAVHAVVASQVQSGIGWDKIGKKLYQSGAITIPAGTKTSPIELSTMYGKPKGGISMTITFPKQQYVSLPTLYLSYEQKIFFTITGMKIFNQDGSVSAVVHSKPVDNNSFTIMVTGDMHLGDVNALGIIGYLEKPFTVNWEVVGVVA